MPPTTSCKRGDIVLVPFPFTDLSSSKQRPALIVSPDALHATRDDVVLVAITSQAPASPADDEVVIGSHDMRSSGLLKPSIVKTGKMFTIHQMLIRKKIGAMLEIVMRRVLETLRRNFQP